MSSGASGDPADTNKWFIFQSVNNEKHRVSSQKDDEGCFIRAVAFFKSTFKIIQACIFLYDEKALGRQLFPLISLDRELLFDMNPGS